MFFDDPLLWEWHLLPSHEFDYLHLINLLLQNKYYIFPIIQKIFLKFRFFSKFVLLDDHTIYNMENFHFSILSLLSFFFHFFVSFFHSFLPSFLPFSFFLFCCFSFVEVDKISEKYKNELLFYIWEFKKCYVSARTSNE